MQLINIKVRCGITGFESPAADYASSSLSLDSLLIKNPSATWVGEASGDSMTGFGIFSGDLLIIDRHVDVKNMDIVVANYNGEFVCKQICLKRRLLLSANPQFSAVKINEDDEFTIEGVVVHSVRAHSPIYLAG